MSKIPYLLEITVFISGAVVMIIEIIGSRILAPFVGTSIYIWTSLIGIVLTSLSVGYYWGGRLADKRQTFQLLSTIILLSSICVGLTAYFHTQVLFLLGKAITDIRIVATIAAILLFAPASILLGMVSPYVVRLKLKQVKTAGETVGRLYAISTIGSILGTFLTGFVLFVFLGSTNILFLLAFVLLILAGLIDYHLPVPKLLWGIVLVVLFFSAQARITSNKQQGFVDIDTRYGRVWMFDRKDWRSDKLIKVMQIDNGMSSAIYHDSDELVFPYSRYYRLAQHFVPQPKSGLLIGGAGYTYPKHYLEHFPEATLDIVEIDPLLQQLAVQYFRFTKDPRLTIYHEDARTFINNSSKKYDVIFGDVYKAKTIPFQLTTIEATRNMYRMLNNGGVLLLNVIASTHGPKSDFLWAQYATQKAVFPYVYVILTVPNNESIAQNVLLVAVKTATEPQFINADSELQRYLSDRWQQNIPVTPPVLTDDFAPVEHYTANLD